MRLCVVDIGFTHRRYPYTSLFSVDSFCAKTDMVRFWGRTDKKENNFIVTIVVIVIIITIIIIIIIIIIIVIIM